MNRLIRAATFAAAVAFVLGACGSTASAAKSASSPSPGGAANAFRNGTSGQLVQINGQTLIVTGPSGDTTVMYTTSTTFTKTSIASLADITKGTCILATGQNSTSGAVVASTVLLSPKTSTGCAARTFVGPSPAPNATPRPSPSPRPSTTPRPSGAPGVFVSGEVTVVSGTSITVLSATKVSSTFTVSATATITDTATVTPSSLQNGQCLRATGSKDTAGNVQATSITITPAGASGTCTTTTGGFGGGRRPGGGGFPGAGG
jgi:hypothetical protein